LAWWVLGFGCAAVQAPQGTADPLRLVTFNLRYGTADDGPNRWELRREFALDEVGALAPDVLALQEALDFQVAEVIARFPYLQVLGEHRDGGTQGEFSGLLIDTRRLEIVQWGEFWLSETPDVVASRGWDAALPRMAVWARLKDREQGREFLAFGTHFDHRGTIARLESARLIVERANHLSGAGALPVALLGDFNAAEASPPSDAFRAAGYVDSFRERHPDATHVATFHAFSGASDGSKIDFVWLSPGWIVRAASIERPRRGAQCPSDHDPVVAEVVFPTRAAARLDRADARERSEFFLRTP